MEFLLENKIFNKLGFTTRNIELANKGMRSTNASMDSLRLVCNESKIMTSKYYDSQIADSQEFEIAKTENINDESKSSIKNKSKTSLYNLVDIYQKNQR